MLAVLIFLGVSALLLFRILRADAARRKGKQEGPEVAWVYTRYYVEEPVICATTPSRHVYVISHNTGAKAFIARQEIG